MPWTVTTLPPFFIHTDAPLRYFALDSFGKFNDEDFVVIYINSGSDKVSTNNRARFSRFFKSPLA